jgi:hypothetical protein
MRAVDVLLYRSSDLAVQHSRLLVSSVVQGKRARVYCHKTVYFVFGVMQ